MPARRSWSFHEGDRYEYFVTFALSAIASVIPVPRQEDYGLDHLGFLTREEGLILYAEDAFGLQVKAESVGATLTYGGLDKKGRWRKEQIEWLYGQTYPLLIGVVAPQEWRLNIYSTAPMWRVKPLAGTPFEVVFHLDTPSGKTSRLVEPVKTRVDSGEGSAGGSWAVKLGPPIVSLSANELRDAIFRKQIYSVLKFWLGIDQRNIRHKAQGIPYAEEIMEWETNKSPDMVKMAAWWYFNPTPGLNQKETLSTLSPMLLGLAFNMLVQKDNDLNSLAGVMQLIKKRGFFPSELEEKFKDLLSNTPKI